MPATRAQPAVPHAEADGIAQGEPQPEQLAPFLADLDDEVLAQVHMEDALRDSVLEFDELLAERLSKLEVPDKLNRDSNNSPVAKCKCPTCGKIHIASK